MSDPVTEALRREEQDRLPFIAVQEFRTEYKTLPDGKVEPYDMVAWVKKGTQNPAVTEEKVARLQKYPDNPIWQVVRPLYERWKAGQTSPIDGTPLAAWPGATPQLVKALEPANIRSVEDLARMEDSAIMRIALPGLREKQKHARSFLEAQVATSGVASENVKLKETADAQAKRIAELEEAVQALAAQQNIDIAEPRRRGRPPKEAAA